MIEFLPMVLSPPGVTVPQIQKEHHVAQQTRQTSLEITRNQSINKFIIKLQQKEHHVAQKNRQTSLEITRNQSINQSIYNQTSTKGASRYSTNQTN